MADALAADTGDTALATGQAKEPKWQTDATGLSQSARDKMLANAEQFETKYEDFARQEAAAAKDRPALPKLEKVGPPPQNDIKGDAMLWLGFATALGGIAGAMTKRSSMNALSAFSGALDGLQQGNQQKFDNNFKTWEAQAKATQENNKVEMDGYRNILERQDLDNKQRAQQLEMWGTMNRNKFMIDIAREAARTGDFSIFASALDSVGSHAVQGNDALARLIEARVRSRDAAQERADIARQQRQEKADEARSMVGDVLDDMAAGKQAPVLTGIYGQNRLIAEQEAHRKGIDLAQLQLKWRTAENLNRSLSSKERANMYAYGNRFATQTVPRLKELAQQLDLKNAPLLNWGQMLALANQTGPRAQLAAQYVAQMRIAQEDIAQISKGGYSPTNVYLEFAQKAIDENMEVGNLQAALDEEQRGVAFTINAFASQGAGVLGPTSTNPYAGGKAPIDTSESGRVPPTTAAPAPTDALAQARDAIAKGAPRDAVMQRLRERGIDPGGL